MKPISAFGIPLGISTSFWALMGAIRFLIEILSKKIRKQTLRRVRMKAKDIAVLVPAHNEEIVIRRNIQSLKQSFSPKQIYVVSDGSIDKTYRRARMEECHVSMLSPGKGKAKALLYLIKRFRIYKKYKLVFICDADNEIDKTLIGRALPFFNDPQISVVFSASYTRWPHPFHPSLARYFISYRYRLNRLLVYFYIYGQTWKHTNVNYVIPGSCTIYRSKVLKKLELDTPGLLIEDFNLAFQLHKRKLGKIGFHPSLISWEQYPHTLRDYWKQVRRWNIGFFQTVRKNGFWPSFFWLSMGTFSLEVFLNSLFITFLPIMVLFYIIPDLTNIHPIFNSVINLQKSSRLLSHITIKGIFYSLFLFDYWMTAVVATIHKKPQLLFYGIFFIFMHYVTSLILLTAVIPGFFSSSEGRWTSPTRRTI